MMLKFYQRTAMRTMDLHNKPLYADKFETATSDMLEFLLLFSRHMN